MTGFEPFGGADVNPSWEAARLASDRALLLPVRFGAALDLAWAAVLERDPAVVLCVGQAAGRGAVSIERVAVNLADAHIPDNGGATPVDEPVVADGPAAYFATIPVKECVEAVRAEDVPVEVSLSAGLFVCNHVFYGLLHRAATRRGGRPRVGFVHVPLLPGQGEPALDAERVALALAAIARASAQASI